MFPFLTGRRQVHVIRLQLFVQSAAAEQPAAGAHIRVKYYPSGHRYEKDDDDDVGGDEFHYRSKVQEFDCVAHAARRGLYRGILDVEIEVQSPSLSAGRKDARNPGCGMLRFPEDNAMGEIREMYLLCQYEVRDKPLRKGDGELQQRVWRSRTGGYG
jgi:hypothetical protein